MGWSAFGAIGVGISLAIFAIVESYAKAADDVYDE